MRNRALHLSPGQGAAPHPACPFQPRPRGSISPTPTLSPDVSSVFGYQVFTHRDGLLPHPPARSPEEALGGPAPGPSPRSQPRAAWLRGNLVLSDAATSRPDPGSTSCLKGWPLAAAGGIPPLPTGTASAGSFQESGWACLPTPQPSRGSGDKSLSLGALISPVLKWRKCKNTSSQDSGGGGAGRWGTNVLVVLCSCVSFPTNHPGRPSIPSWEKRRENKSDTSPPLSGNICPQKSRREGTSVVWLPLHLVGAAVPLLSLLLLLPPRLRVPLPFPALPRTRPVHWLRPHPKAGTYRWRVVGKVAAPPLPSFSDTRKLSGPPCQDV
ncbi:uncharacterized protein LOC141573540 [Camelus bactrianus]|uniref:Uncharacterized protein LOC141573540 n=1 Tax=Camelus bactrianus TaxID=9837 RepID=A0AC58NJR5_CAMBA